MAVDAAAGGAGALASSEGVGEAGTMAEEAGGGGGAAADLKGDGLFTRDRHSPPPHDLLIHGFKSCLFCAVEQDADDVKTCTESRLTERAVAAVIASVQSCVWRRAVATRRRSHAQRCTLLCQQLLQLLILSLLCRLRTRPRGHIS